MDQILYDYSLNATTWVYLSSLLTIAVFFKFNRVWSVRNLDLLGLIAFAPGLLLAARADADLKQLGYTWMFSVGGWFLIRMLVDRLMVRRPLLEPNLSPGGLTFLTASLLVFLMVNVLTYPPDDHDLAVARQVDRVVSLDGSTAQRNEAAELDLKNRPGFFLMMWLPSISTAAIMDADPQLTDAAGRAQAKQIVASRTTAILSHLAVVLGLVLIGLRHFDNIRAGISAATLYLLLPYTAQMTGHVDHALPAALLVWAVAAYKFPLLAGVLIGVASGVIYYPLFLLPLWCGFYWQKGLYRFILGVFASWGVLIGVSAFLLHGTTAFWESLKAMFGWSNLTAASTDAGFWAFSDSIAPYRIPVMVAFFVLSLGFALWPTQKNLGTLISSSAAVMLGTQFWHLDRGGIYMGWYLPLLLLTVFRPNLEDRVAVSALGQAWLAKHGLPWRKRAA
jgi:hypothetical protein